VFIWELCYIDSDVCSCAVQHCCVYMGTVILIVMCRCAVGHCCVYMGTVLY
jgi:hypothetical protein